MSEPDLRIGDFKDFAVFAANLKQAEKSLRLKVNRSIREAGKPVAVEVIRRGAANLPRSGGLRDRVMQANPLVSVISNGVSLTLRDQKKTNLSALDKGYVRHPAWAKGDRSSWRWAKLPQPLPGMRGKFTQAFEDIAAPTIAPKLLGAMQEALNEVTEGLH